MGGKIKSRLAKIEGIAGKAVRTLPTYDCIIEGEHIEMTLLDFVYTTGVLGKAGEMGRRIGEITLPPPDPGALERAFEEMQAEYNSPEAEAKRKAEAEELKRIGELRRQDFECGRDMDKCHPLPWQKGYEEHE